jgi:hypothetical protein
LAELDSADVATVYERHGIIEPHRLADVAISSTDKEALNAIHRFLRFQIDEHKTGTPVQVH